MQLSETAAAILADDEALGITRNDAVLKRLARGKSKNSAPSFAIMFYLLVLDMFACPKGSIVLKALEQNGLQARAAFTAFDKEEMRAPIKVSRVKVGETTNHPFIMPTDFVKALAASKKLHMILPHRDLEKCKATLKTFWARWKLQHGHDHKVFEEVATKDLELTIPVRLHGDEGRSVLVLN